jgi:hypothetical protein
MRDRAAGFVKMRAVDLFADAVGIDGKTRERAERAYKGVRTIHSAVRLGRAAASKTNLLLAWLEAGNALLDAIDSYAAYRQAAEVTKQLEVEGDALRVQLAEIRKQCQAEAALAEHERTQHAAATRRTLAERRDDVRVRREHYDACKACVQDIGNELTRLRRTSSPGCPRLAAVERGFYRLAHEQVQAAITLVDS